MPDVTAGFAANASARRAQLETYESFFGLRERPFELVPNPKFLFLSARQREALSNLRLGLATPRGLTLLLGEAGTGKTTIVQSVLADLDRASIQCVLVSNPTLTRGEFYETLVEGFGLSAEAGQSKAKFLSEFRALLESRHAAGLLSAMVLDEAQSLSFELLEEVRLLSNIETSTTKLLNVILAGQPELADRLNDPQLRQLKQRISLRCELKPLSVSETAAYIAGRLRIAGGEPATIFSREAIAAIQEASGGVPRIVNVICDNALLSGFASQSKPILRSIIEEITRDFDLRAVRPDRSLSEAPRVAVAPLAPAPAPAPSVADAEAAGRKPEARTGDTKKRFSFF